MDINDIILTKTNHKNYFKTTQIPDNNRETSNLFETHYLRPTANNSTNCTCNVYIIYKSDTPLAVPCNQMMLSAVINLYTNNQIRKCILTVCGVCS